ncbi:phosphoadenosine phosphosulfate reductase domain-containing protein [Metallosphaera sedula]|uniref:phosphoadenosine phosphosulfate reductase domain-containing protein n=1 Tax=Metallosphaera sedula TaxID=43687 RepID=UPI0020BF3E49|nr:phosphoadenosine phosphosulfate reductase family protein [Metallosphaera sedula]BBL48360.1 phosphoadenosine phosphosulfate reductase [Metallosphaera sedula]
MDLEEKVESTINFIVDISKEQDPTLPWELGFSGGKDSTTVLSLLIDAMERGARISKLYVVYSDTLLEHPTLRKEALEALNSLKGFTNIELVRLTPKEDFITMMVEKGYPAPNHHFRWCMARLKIRPMHEFMRKLGNYVQVSGVRRSESAERAKNIKHYGNAEKVVKIGNPIIMPILDWTTEDVFNFLRTRKRWDGKDFNYLLELYEVKEDSCGCALSSDVRFGCWVCTVVKIDKMPTNPILKWAKQRILEISRDPRMRNYDKEGRPRSLNEEGRREVAKVFLEVAEKYPEALGYNIDELKDKLRKIAYGDTQLIKIIQG